MTTDFIISKVWSFCTTLRDDGVGNDAYLDQLTDIIFLQRADEYSRPALQSKGRHPGGACLADDAAS